MLHLMLQCRGPTHLSVRVSKVNLQTFHGSDDGDDGLDGVAVHDCFVLFALLL